MKKLSLSCILPFLLCGALLAGPIESELVKLKTQREAAIAKFTAEIDKQYAKELTKLQEKALSAKDLDGAIAVKAELKNFGVTGASPSSSASPSSKDEIKKFITGNQFKYIGSTTSTFKMNEDGTVSGIGNFLTGWKITGNRELTFIGWDHKLTMVIDMSADWKSGKLNTKKSTKKDETSGAIALNMNEAGTEPIATTPVSSGNSDPDNTAFGRRQ